MVVRSGNPRVDAHVAIDFKSGWADLPATNRDAAMMQGRHPNEIDPIDLLDMPSDHEDMSPEWTNIICTLIGTVFGGAITFFTTRLQIRHARESARTQTSSSYEQQLRLIQHERERQLETNARIEITKALNDASDHYAEMTTNDHAAHSIGSVQHYEHLYIAAQRTLNRAWSIYGYALPADVHQDLDTTIMEIANSNSAAEFAQANYRWTWQDEEANSPANKCGFCNLASSLETIAYEKALDSSPVITRKAQP